MSKSFPICSFRHLFMFIIASSIGTSSARGVSLEWIRQVGTSSDESVRGMSADVLGNVFTSGDTKGSLGGPNAGSYDVFVTKYDAAGNFQWTRQIGTSSIDAGGYVSADGLGNVYVSGGTNGNLGGTNAGGNDAFVSKYDAAGNLQWMRQLGTNTDEICRGVSADGLGNVYISGETYGSLGGSLVGSGDAFVSKYDSAGNLHWTRQLGTAALEMCFGVSADRLGNVYISGQTNGSLGGTNAGDRDTFVTKYDAVGNLQWTRQLGTSAFDASYGVSVDDLGNVFISGLTSGNLAGTNAGGEDAFVSKYNAAGNLQWTRQLGTSLDDVSVGMSVDGLGNVYISGYTSGGLGGTNAGGSDAFISKFDAAGNLQWSQQFGTSNNDGSGAVSTDRLGHVYVSGITSGILGGTNAGGVDAFVAKFADAVPEPSTFLVAGLSLIPFAMRFRRHRRHACSGNTNLRLAPSLVVIVALATAECAQAQQQLFKLMGSGYYTSARYETQVALNGTTAIVGAPGESLGYPLEDRGAAFLFDVTTGEQRVKLLASDAQWHAQLGKSVALNDDFAFVGAPFDSAGGDGAGTAYVFDPMTGSQIRKITAFNAATDRRFGWSVSLSGKVGLVGSPATTSVATPGSCYLFDLGTGQQLSEIKPSDSAVGDSFGSSVALHDNVALIGAPPWRDTKPGSAYLFDTSSSQQLQQLTASDGAPGDRFGQSVALSDNWALVGAPQWTFGPGAAYLFDATTGQQLMKFTASDASAKASFGNSVALSGNLAIIGAPGDNNSSGAAYIFDVRTGQQLAKLREIGGSLFGLSVALNGSLALVGTYAAYSNLYQVGSVPEPSTALLMVLGLSPLVFSRSSRRLQRSARSPVAYHRAILEHRSEDLHLETLLAKSRSTPL